MIHIKELLQYEIRSSLWTKHIAWRVSWRWLDNIAAFYFAWKTRRKYKRYRDSILEQQFLKNNL